MKSSARLAVTMLLLAPALSWAWSTAEAQSTSDLAGAWVVSSWESADGEVNSSPQRGLFVFTATGHYSMMYVPGSEPRAELSETSIDADFVAAYNSFVANSGRYTIDGNEITYEAFMAKDAAYMGRFAPTGGEGNAQSFAFELSDGVLTLSAGEGGPMQGSTVTLSRPGGAE